MRSGPLSLLALIGAVALLGSASAQTPVPTRLVYTRGAGAERCPDEEAIRNAVAARLGHSPFVNDSSARQISAALSHDGKALRAHLEVRDAAGQITGSRDILSEKNDCDELASSVALAISIAIDPLSITRPTPSASSPVASAPVASSPPPPPAPPVTVFVERPAPPPPAPPGDPLRLRATAGLVVSFGSAPAPAVGGAVSGGVRWRSLSLALEGRVDLPASKKSDSGGEVSSSLLLASLVPCAHHGVLAGCALLSLGALQGTGTEVTTPRKETTAFGAAGGRIAVEIPVSSAIAVRLHGDLTGTITRTTLRISGQEIWSTSPIAGSLGLGVTGTF